MCDEDFLECRLVFSDESELIRQTKLIHHKETEKTGFIDFKWSEEENKTGTKENLISASVWLNAGRHIISLYFPDASFIVNEKTKLTTKYRHIDNKHGVGCDIECSNNNGRIKSFTFIVDYLKLKLVLTTPNECIVEE